MTSEEPLQAGGHVGDYDTNLKGPATKREATNPDPELLGLRDSGRCPEVKGARDSSIHGKAPGTS